MLELVVPEFRAGERLDRFLAAAQADLSRSRLQSLIREGRVLVNGKIARASLRLHDGDQVQVELPPERIVKLAAEDIPLSILYEDESILVVDKPAGMVVHPGAGVASGTLVHALLHRDPRIAAVGGAGRPGIVHRLDRDTSGLIALARTDEAHRRLSKLVRERAFERTYLALVRGRPRSRGGRIEAAIGRDRDDPTRISLDTDTPRETVTLFDVEQLWPEHALLRVRLETGRMHQIRVHLAAVELPVAGDPVYGVPAPPLQLPARVQMIMREGTRQECWEAVYSTGKNEPGQLKAKSD